MWEDCAELTGPVVDLYLTTMKGQILIYHNENKTKISARHRRQQQQQRRLHLELPNQKADTRTCGDVTAVLLVVKCVSVNVTLHHITFQLGLFDLMRKVNTATMWLKKCNAVHG
ncbi:hypothetical protein JOB18_046035 [Solea senegalensis]|uniref:Uncharacterized protein n=1 Tax=Solea senegalensis TaxID=28829 RepID=A0AAV6S5X2_SOLSE|nr:hypothetical protein JOB18_046035 [Solea senegalensis]